MSKNNDHINYDAEYLTRYHAGQLPAEEMHALEKAALNDPFLADALVGLAFDAEARQNLELLESRIDDMAGKAEPAGGRVVSFGSVFTKIAAAAIIIFGLGYVSWLLYKPADNTGETTLASKTTVKAPVSTHSDTALTQFPVAEPAKSLAPVNEAAQPQLKPAPVSKSSAPALSPASNDPNSRAATPEINTPMQDATVATDNAMVKDDVAKAVAVEKAAEVANYDVQTVTTAAPPAAALKKNAESFSRVSAEELSKRNMFTGLVTDNAGRPVANATVTVEKTQARFTTDQSGKYYISNNTGRDSTSLIIAKTGYAPEIVMVTADKTLNTKLDNQARVSTALAAAPAAKRIQVMYNGSGAPVNCLSEYQRYVDEEIKTGILNDNPGLTTGTVTLMFDTDMGGTVSNIRVKRGSNQAAISIARRLIENGPKWTVSNMKNLELNFVFR